MPESTTPRPSKSIILHLNESDSAFASMDTPGSPSHIGGLAIIAPSTSTDCSFEHFVRTAEKRVALVPRLGWRLDEVPFGLDRPYWAKDDKFDVPVTSCALPSRPLATTRRGRAPPHDSTSSRSNGIALSWR